MCLERERQLLKGGGRRLRKKGDRSMKVRMLREVPRGKKADGEFTWRGGRRFFPLRRKRGEKKGKAPSIRGGRGKRVWEDRRRSGERGAEQSLWPCTGRDGENKNTP